MSDLIVIPLCPYCIEKYNQIVHSSLSLEKPCKICGRPTKIRSQVYVK